MEHLIRLRCQFHRVGLDAESDATQRPSRDAERRTPVGLQGSPRGFAARRLSDGDSVPVTRPWLSGKGISPPTQSAAACCTQRKNTRAGGEAPAGFCDSEEETSPAVVKLGYKTAKRCWRYLGSAATSVPVNGEGSAESGALLFDVSMETARAAPG
ncbi:hypothetical protein EYF80_033377 [Liparis tanakae]|uniref:Uncharacterized protein n=1 Tax=Liparis tanakae TaxID=230148 RepID=A0A4Z2GSE4_9TELE|nr:hypothetical protein EYF80_033377 [Liparis tanakae]